MALRHRFAFKALPDFRAEEEPQVPPAVMRPAHVVEFRPESDLDKIVGEISRYSRVRLSAAPGAGKSTRLPIKIAEIMKVPVLIAVPSEHLADQHFQYLSGKSPSEYAIALEETDVMADRGVTITSYAWMSGKLLQSKGQGVDHKPFGDCVVFADEVHESDSFSEFVRRIGSGIPGVRCFVSASATHDPARMPKLEAKGETETKFFSRSDAPASWNPTDYGKPWSMSSLTGNTLIFLDDEKAAVDLVRKYAVLGVSAYRMTSRMKRSDAKAAFDEMRNPNAGLVVMVADYSFRNGFTYEITRIIDSALVKVTYVENGELKKTYRVMYEIEKYQTMARGGRTAGSKCEYYMPESMVFKSAICSLEEIEAEAAAVMYRACGYGLPSEVKSCVKLPMGKIPKSMFAALTGFVPLAMLPEADLVDLVMPKLAVDVEVAEVLDSYGIDASPVVTTSDLFAGLDVVVPKVAPTVVTTDLLCQLQELSSAAKTLTPGYYYSCSSAKDNGSMGYASWETILESVHAAPLVVTGYSQEMREDAVFKLLLQYNQFVVLESAATRVGAQQSALVEIVRQYPEEVKTWAKWLSSKLQHSKAMSASLLKAISLIRTPAMVFKVVAADVDLEEKKAREMVAPLRSAVQGASQPVDQKAFFAEVGGQMGYDPGPEFPGQDRPSVEQIEDGKSSGQLRWKAVPMVGGLMHDMWFSPGDPMRWGFDDYVAAVQHMVSQKGVVAESVRRLVIDAPGVDAASVMQAVRDGGGKPRKQNGFSVVRVRGKS